MNTEFGIVIQARCNSKRLPNKVIMEFLGEPLLIYKCNLIRRLNIDLPIVIATTKSGLDDIIVEICTKQGIECYRGDETNVFQRFQEVVLKYNFKNIIRLTGDNPFTHQRLLKEGITKHKLIKADLTTTRLIKYDHSIVNYVPKGFSFDILSCSSLLKISSLKLTDFEREHVIPYFYFNEYVINYIHSDLLQEEYTIDTLEQFNRISELAKRLTEAGKLINFLTN
jgi:spore coat polysaccharide biosynthesis protein SpsF